MSRQIELFAPRGLGDDGAGERLTLGRFAKVIGTDAAIKLGRDFAGTRLYVPSVLDQEHPIAQSIGIEDARELARRFGGEAIEIPLLKSRAEYQRDRAEIIKLRRQDLTVAEIARAVGCSERHAYNVLSEEEA